MSFFFVIIQHPKITVRIQDEVLALRTYYNSYLGADKVRSASGRPPATRDAQHPESGVLNSFLFLKKILTTLIKCINIGNTHRTVNTNQAEKPTRTNQPDDQADKTGGQTSRMTRLIKQPDKPAG